MQKNIKINMQSIIKPNLVNHKTIKKLTKSLQKPIGSEPTWKENLLYFYSDYIRPNLFALLVMVLVTIYLSIKYFLKKESDEQLKRKKKIKKKRALIKKMREDSENLLLKQNIDNAPYFQNNETKQMKNKQLYADDEENRNDDEISYYSLSKEYENEINNNDGSYTEMMLRDSLEEKRKRMTFDEMTKMLLGE